jgi:hypothetical protein
VDQWNNSKPTICIRWPKGLIFVAELRRSPTRLSYDMKNVVRAAERPGVNFFVSAQYLKNEMSDLNETWYTHAWW